MFIPSAMLLPTLTGASIFVDPSSLSDLAMWVDASDTPTLTLDGSNNVSVWADKSGNGRNLSQATVANRPAYVTNQLNGMPGVQRTEAGGQSMTAVSSVTSTEDTIFMICKLPATTSGSFDGIFSNRGNCYMQAGLLNWEIGNSTNGSGAIRSGDSPAVDKFVVLCFRRSASQNKIAYYENGARVYETTYTYTTGAISGSFQIASQPMSITYCEIIHYTRYLSDTERLNVENYLAAKWNVYTVFAGRRDLNDGVQRYATANDITSVAGLPAPKPMYGIFGQSNAGGLTNLAPSNPALSNPIPNAYINLSNGAPQQLQYAVNNLPNSGDADSHGVELSMMYDLGNDFGASYVCKYSSGGTNLADRWQPGQLQFEAFVSAIANFQYRVGLTTGINLLPSWFVWWQGEQDSMNGGAYVTNYQANEQAMVAGLRARVYGGSGIKIISKKIVYTTANGNAVNAAKQANADGGIADYVVLERSVNTIDGTHATSDEQVATGNAAALIMGATTQIS